MSANQYRCRKCECEIHPSEKEIKHRKMICESCLRIQHREYRAHHPQKRYPASPAKIKSDRKHARTEKCKAARRRQYANAKLNPLWRIRNIARNAVRLALDRGDLVRKPCETCGNLKSEAHHDDYNLPLQVKWLCRKHHIQAHGNRNVTT